MDEKWLDIKDYEGLYKISDNGKVYSFIVGRELSQTNNKTGKGYLYVDLHKNGKRRRYLVHRLVAEHFIVNNENKPYVNHKDGDTKNNIVNNLEWVTPLENVKHAVNILGVMNNYALFTERTKREVIQYDYTSNEVIKHFKSISEAGKELGVNLSNIIMSCQGDGGIYKGFYFKYAEDKNKPFVRKHRKLGLCKECGLIMKKIDEHSYKCSKCGCEIPRFVQEKDRNIFVEVVK